MEFILQFVNGGIKGIDDISDVCDALGGKRPETVPLFVEQEYRNGRHLKSRGAKANKHALALCAS